MMVNIPLIVLILAPMLASASKGQLPMERIDGNDWYTLQPSSPSLVNKRNAPPANAYEDKGDKKSVVKFPLVPDEMRSRPFSSQSCCILRDVYRK